MCASNGGDDGLDEGFFGMVDGMAMVEGLAIMCTVAKRMRKKRRSNSICVAPDPLLTSKGRL